MEARSPEITRWSYRDFWPTHEATLNSKSKRRLLEYIAEKGITNVGGSQIQQSWTKRRLVNVIFVEYFVDHFIEYEKSLGPDLNVDEFNRRMEDRSNEMLQQY